ncbi:ice-binding family protein [Glacieibacterium sp.]|uniref:ice-binding family protein n=1 Tax=Glacieibacterium sp. TaxID=2860237 RepID=UPI003B0084AD
MHCSSKFTGLGAVGWLIAFGAPALSAPLLGPEFQRQTIISKTYTTTGDSSVVHGNVFAGGVSTTGANADVLGNLVSGGAATTGGTGSTVTGNIVSGGVATTGDGSLIGGSVTSSGASTIGANSRVTGDVTSVGAATTGDTSWVGGTIQTGGAASTGANSVVVGAVGAVGAISVGANSLVGSQYALAASPFVATELTASLDAEAATHTSLIRYAQTALKSLGIGTVLAATMTTDTTLYSGVYSAASLSTTAGTTLTLDGQGKLDQVWVFNIADILATGASTKIVMINAGAGSGIIWNTGGYASLGASSVFLGTILAETYISVGADAETLGVTKTCGGLFSASSYVSTGAGAKVGGYGCYGIGSVFNVDNDGKVYRPVTIPPPEPSDNTVPEPQAWIMMLAGFFIIGSASRRRARRQAVAS